MSDPADNRPAPEQLGDLLTTLAGLVVAAIVAHPFRFIVLVLTVAAIGGIADALL